MPEPHAILTITERGGLRTEVDTRTGNIKRLDMPFTPSGQWRMTGLAEARPFGRISTEYPSPVDDVSTIG